MTVQRQRQPPPRRQRKRHNQLQRRNHPARRLTKLANLKLAKVVKHNRAKPKRAHQLLRRRRNKVLAQRPTTATTVLKVLLKLGSPTKNLVAHTQLVTANTSVSIN